MVAETLHSPPNIEAILTERARQLARPLAAEERGHRQDYLIMRIESETYAIDCRYVQRVARSSGIAAIPGTPAFVSGAIRLQEEIHCVFDLHALLGGTRLTISDDAKIVALGDRRLEFCLLADEVLGIEAVVVEDVRPPDFVGQHRGRRFIQGVTNSAILILDAQALLSDQDLYIGGATHIESVEGGQR